MSGTYSGYGGAPSTWDTSALPSSALWHQVDADLNRPGRWVHEFHDFATFPYTAEALPTTEDPYQGLRVFSSTGGVFGAVDAEGGQRTLGSDGDDEGAAVAGGFYPYKIIQGAGELVYECRLKLTTIAADLVDFFAGLIEDVALTAVVPITATQGLIADQNMVGFFHDSTDATTSATVNTTYKANTVAVVDVGTIGAAKLEADTFLKLGMIFNRRNDNLLEFTLNGQVLPDTKAIPSAAGTDFPNDVRLGWVFGVTNTAATTDRVTLDWVRVAQKRVTQ
jgi:hypothetical protein